MDLRVQRTKNNIINAFLALRAHKPLEKITVKELAERAMINKATFYLHYKDVYDLSEILEQEVLGSVVQNISNLEYLFTDTERFVTELMDAYFARWPLIQILFSGNRMDQMPAKIEAEIRKVVREKDPKLEGNLVLDVLLPYTIYGGHYAYMHNQNHDLKAVLQTIGKLTDAARRCSGIEFESEPKE